MVQRARGAREKNVDLLLATSEFARLVHAGRATSCKSAKDRTSMSVTLEQARILMTHHGLPCVAPCRRTRACTLSQV